MLILGLAQTVVSYRGDSLIPGLGGNRPVLGRAQEGGHRAGIRRRCRGSEDGSGGAGGRRGAGVCRDRRADLAADPRPGTRASGDQRVHARAVGAGRDRTSTAMCSTSPTAKPRATTANWPSTRATRCSCRCRPRSPARPGCWCGPTRTPTSSTSSGPSSTLAVTIPTVDPHRGRLIGIAVQLPTLVRDEEGNEFPSPHAEWSVRTVWP